jgi:hypothetical protein
MQSADAFIGKSQIAKKNEATKALAKIFIVPPSVIDVRKKAS